MIDRSDLFVWLYIACCDECLLERIDDVATAISDSHLVMPHDGGDEITGLALSDAGREILRTLPAASSAATTG
jgi:hypothetical protein